MGVIGYPCPKPKEGLSNFCYQRPQTVPCKGKPNKKNIDRLDKIESDISGLFCAIARFNVAQI